MGYGDPYESDRGINPITPAIGIQDLSPTVKAFEDNNSNDMSNVYQPSPGHNSLGQDDGSAGQAGQAAGMVPNIGGMFGGQGAASTAESASGAASGAQPAASGGAGSMAGMAGMGGPIVGALMMYNNNLQNLGRKGRKLSMDDAVSLVAPGQSKRFGGGPNGGRAAPIGGGLFGIGHGHGR